MPLNPDTRLGPYQILAPLGAGGMGEVYRAKDSRLDRDVAIKVLPEQLASDPAALARFAREAKALAALSHPNILAVYDVGREARVSYVVLELLEGETLSSRLKRGPLDWRESLRTAEAIADGLAAAHTKGIIHRDLKPQNIFLIADGRVKILDFGLAYVSTDRSKHRDDPAQTQTLVTRPNMAVGTSGYMAPEQLRGQPLDGRCDIFAFGCVVYETLAGRRAFAGKTPADTMTAVLNDRPIDLLSLGIRVPDELQRIVLQCLEKDPTRRFQSAQDLSIALGAATADAAAHRSLGGKRARKLCVCGRSQSLPFCDGSHAADNWTCSLDSTWASIGFCTSERFQNLAFKLASHYQGVLCLPGHPWPVVDRLVFLLDGADLEFPLRAQQAVEARNRIVFTLGVAAGLLRTLFDRCRVVELSGVDPLEAFRGVRTVLDAEESYGGEESQPITLRTAFISHAINDESVIMPVMSYLRRYFRADLFLCADSIPPGAEWRNTIMAALRDKEYFVALLSEATTVSHFCSFEMGAAFAADKPIKLFSLDGTSPPVFIQHLQVVDLPRALRQKPWLEKQDVLLQELLRVLGNPVRDGIGPRESP